MSARFSLTLVCLTSWTTNDVPDANPFAFFCLSRLFVCFFSFFLFDHQNGPDEFVPCPESLDEIERASLAFQVTAGLPLLKTLRLNLLTMSHNYSFCQLDLLKNYSTMFSKFSVIDSFFTFYSVFVDPYIQNYTSRRWKFNWKWPWTNAYRW